MKTFEQIAKELNKSKQSVYKKYKNKLYEQLKPHIETIGNTIFINEIGEQIIIDDYNNPKNINNQEIILKLDEIILIGTKILSYLETTNNNSITLSNNMSIQDNKDFENKDDKSQKNNAKLLSKKPISTDEEIKAMILEGKKTREIIEICKTSFTRIAKLRKELEN